MTPPLSDTELRDEIETLENVIIGLYTQCMDATTDPERQFWSKGIELASGKLSRLTEERTRRAAG